MDLLKNVQDRLFPVVWADETAELDKENEELFKATVIFAENLVLGISIAFGFVVGGLLFLAGLYMCWQG